MWILLENVVLFLTMTDFWLLPIHTQVLLVLVGLVMAAFVVRVLINLYDYIALGREGRLALRLKTKRFWEKSE